MAEELNLALSVLLVLVSAGFVAAPFLRGPTAAETAADGPRPWADRKRLEDQKRDAYAALKEAEFDQRMGKLSDADFAGLREKYTQQAIDAIAGLEEMAETRRLGEARTVPRTGARGGASKPGRVRRIAYCPSCGHAVPPRANFCTACGRSLKEEVA